MSRSIVSSVKNLNPVQSQLSDESILFLKEMIDAMPFIVMILNEDREIIFSNAASLTRLAISQIGDFFGKRPGQALDCIHSHSASGCGTSDRCQFCGALNAILRSGEENRLVSREFRLSSVSKGVESAYDYMATSRPFMSNGKRFLIFTLEDISNEKRRQVLERIFFHDILNTAGNLKMISEMLLSNGDEIEREHLIAILSKVSTELVDEIEAQKQLYAAETGSLRLNNTELTTHEIFSTIIDQFNTDHHRNQVLRIGDGSTDTAFVSDRSLLVRIIKNMVKNALEASGENDTITLLSKKEGNILRFEVKNPAFISRDVQLQIFKRSFSTKSLDRGLGTYSMKILGENYLKGRVYFTSSEKKGTIFFFDLPLSTESTLPA